MPRSITNKILRSRRSSGSSQASAGSVFSGASSFLTDPDPEELDCFRSMRGTAVDTTRELNDAMQDDIQDLSDRLVTVRKSGEAEKRVQDGEGQAYQILVTKDDVRLCHVDEKGHYHFEHFGAYSKDNDSNNATGRSSSSPPHSNNSRKRRRRHQDWQIVDDGHGRPFLLISPMWVIVLHLEGIWCCQRIMGKVLDSDTTKGVVAQAPKPWLRKHGRENFQPNVFRGSNDSSAAQSDASDEEKDTEPLLCANTPGERGIHPRAFKSFYHDM